MAPGTDHGFRNGRKTWSVPVWFQLVGLGGLEPPTPRLSSVCSNQLSYRPRWVGRRNVRLQLLASDLSGCSRSVAKASLKEVIQPQVPLRLPCYDFTPVIGHTVDGA